MRQRHAIDEVYLAELQVEELFRFSPRFRVYIESEEYYVPVVDQTSYEMAVDYLVDLFRFQAKKNKLNLSGRHAT